jgi:hypothetical protein
MDMTLEWAVRAAYHRPAAARFTQLFVPFCR